MGTKAHWKGRFWLESETTCGLEIMVQLAHACIYARERPIRGILSFTRLSLLFDAVEKYFPSWRLFVARTLEREARRLSLSQNKFETVQRTANYASTKRAFNKDDIITKQWHFTVREIARENCLRSEDRAHFFLPLSGMREILHFPSRNGSRWAFFPFQEMRAKKVDSDRGRCTVETLMKMSVKVAFFGATHFGKLPELAETEILIRHTIAAIMTI